ncbi:ABC transporter permease [Aquisphaera insulae]|uniref:ABC transporter permease n=1 Tax=Aquisphaera insulae TaxID=2712864 RepID=UPI0013E9E612|nr:ABC transporter permease [Aquisphaera insulae]
MIPDLLREWLDNPMFLRHVRSRCRRPALISGAIITGAICLCIAYVAFQFGTFQTGGAFGSVLAVQGVLLCLMGASQVGTSVASARASGMLDFHRVSPLTPTELTLGYFFGAPIREYLLFLITIPLSLLCVAAGTPDIRGFVQVMIALIAFAWVAQAIALINGLTSKRPSMAKGIVWPIIVIGLTSGSFFPSFGFVANLLDRDPRLDFFGVSLPWLAVVLLYQAPILLVAFLASRRKFESERLHPLSKPQAIGAMAVAGTLAVGSTWSSTESDFIGLLILYVLVALGIFLTITVTPTQADHYKGLLRCLRKGEERPSWLADFALNRPFLVVICGIVLGSTTLVWQRSLSQTQIAYSGLRDGFPLAIANGVLVIAYFGLAYQYFLARFGRRGMTFLTLFVFMAWLLPLFLGTIIVASDYRAGSQAQVVYALSPLAGIGLSAGTTTSFGVGPAENFPWVAGAAITPTLLFTFVFNTLLSTAKKRFRKVVGDAAKWSNERDASAAREEVLGEWESAEDPSPSPAGGLPTSTPS